MMFTRYAFAASLVCGVAASASASTIDMKYTGLHFGSSTRTVTVQSSFSGGFSGTVYAGPLRHEVSNGTGIGANLAPAGGSRIISTFCTELTQFVNQGSPATYDIGPVSDAPYPHGAPLNGGMGATRAHAISLLWAGVSDKFSDALIAAAFQVAVWEIVYDFDGSQGSFDLTDGNVSFNAHSSIISAANNMFNSFVWNTNTDSLFDGPGQPGLVALSNETFQDQLVVIPLPAQGLMAGLGLVGIAAMRRRRI